MPFVLVFFLRKSQKILYWMEGPPFPSNFMVGADVCSANPLQKMKPVITLLHYCQRRKLKRENDQLLLLWSLPNNWVDFLETYWNSRDNIYKICFESYSSKRKKSTMNWTKERIGKRKRNRKKKKDKMKRETEKRKEKKERNRKGKEKRKGKKKRDLCRRRGCLTKSLRVKQRRIVRRERPRERPTFLL